MVFGKFQWNSTPLLGKHSILLPLLPFCDYVCVTRLLGSFFQPYADEPKHKGVLQLPSKANLNTLADDKKIE